MIRGDDMSDTTAPTIHVNGQSETLVATLAALLEKKEIDARGIAIALNGSVVPRAAWRETRLKPGDAVEIVRARQGG
jgi:sulfur carrier protein